MSRIAILQSHARVVPFEASDRVAGVAIGKFDELYGRSPASIRPFHHAASLSGRVVAGTSEKRMGDDLSENTPLFSLGFRGLISRS
jgi:hypothetical protein